jgi:hypothetical protein
MKGTSVMLLIKRYRWLAFVAVLPLAVAQSGCGASHARYSPTAWKDGKPYGPIAATPSVQIADSSWQAGEQLESFQIGEEVDGDEGTKEFTVSLKTKKPVGEQSVRYFVHGRDPVWVYREEDYKRMANMDNNPVPASRAKAGSNRKSRGR